MPILVQCTICGRTDALDGFWAEEFHARGVLPCMLTESCMGQVITRHELCSRSSHRLARNLEEGPGDDRV